jgi:hypothetical protein
MCRFRHLIAIVALSAGALANGQENLGFEVQVDNHPIGWSLDGANSRIEIDTRNTHSGRNSVKLVSNADDSSLVRVRQSIDTAELVGDQIRVSAWFRSTEVLRGQVFIDVIAFRHNGRISNDAHIDYAVTEESDWRRALIAVTLTNESIALADEFERIVFAGGMRGSGVAWFDDFEVEVIDTSSLPPASPDVVNYVSDVLDLMEQQSFRRDQIDWPTFRQDTFRAIRGIDSIRDSYSALRRAVFLLRDRHSGFFTPERVESFAQPIATVGGIRPWVAPRGEAISDRIGYLWVPGFAGSDVARVTRFADEIQQEIARIDSPEMCGWVIDVRDNNGGNLYPMLTGLGPFIEGQNLGGAILSSGETFTRRYSAGEIFVDTSDGSNAVTEISGDPYVLQNVSPPVAVLIGPRTASSGEMTAMAFIGRPSTLLFGAPTRGATSGPQRFPLADGASLNLATTVATDRTGKMYGGSVAPDVFVEPANSELPTASQPEVIQAVSWLQTDLGCS